MTDEAKLHYKSLVALATSNLLIPRQKEAVYYALELMDLTFPPPSDNSRGGRPGHERRQAVSPGEVQIWRERA